MSQRCQRSCRRLARGRSALLALTLLSASVTAVAADAPAGAQPAEQGGAKPDEKLFKPLHIGFLPDLKRGQQAAAEGRLDDAEQDLLPLAERGYVDAQLALGRLYMRIGTAERVDAAIAWLRKAHDRAPDAVAVPLGRLLLRRNEPAQLAEAERLLSGAYQRHGDADALSGLIRLYADYPERDVQRRAPALVAKAEASGDPDALAAAISWYRNTAEQPAHRGKLLQLCRAALDRVPECYVELARATREAGEAKALKQLVDTAGEGYRAGRVPASTLASIARTLVDVPDENGADGGGALSAKAGTAAPLPLQVSDVPENEYESELQTVAARASAGPRSCAAAPLAPTVVSAAGKAAAPGGAAAAAKPAAEPQPDLANELLGRLAKGSGEAPALAAGVIARYPYLLPSFDVEQALQRGAQQGLAEAHLSLGQLYLQGARAPRDPRQALAELSSAAREPATALHAHYLLGRLYLNGYLDEAQPTIAAQHLMWAARRGFAPADAALARLFAAGKGVCPNLQNAYVFAQLGAREGSAIAAALAGQIAARLTPEQRAAAQQLAEAERRIRPQDYQIPDTALASAEPSRAAPAPGGSTPPPAASTRPALPPAQNKTGADAGKAPSGSAGKNQGPT